MSAVPYRWTVEISDEVEQWYATLKDTDRAAADVALNASLTAVPSSGCHIPDLSTAGYSSFGSTAKGRHAESPTTSTLGEG